MLMFAFLLKNTKQNHSVSVTLCKTGARTEFFVKDASTVTCLKLKANRKCNWFTSKIPTIVRRDCSGLTRTNRRFSRWRHLLLRLAESFLNFLLYLHLVLPVRFI